MCREQIDNHLVPHDGGHEVGHAPYVQHPGVAAQPGGRQSPGGVAEVRALLHPHTRLGEVLLEPRLEHCRDTGTVTTASSSHGLHLLLLLLSHLRPPPAGGEHPGACSPPAARWREGGVCPTWWRRVYYTIYLRMFGGECCSVAATQVPSARAAHMSVAMSGDFINDLNVVS